MGTVASAAPAGTRAPAAARGPIERSIPAVSVLRMVLPPFIGGKLVALFVPMLTVWSSSTTAGHPSYQAFLQPFGLWDGDAYRSIAVHGYPGGHLDPTPGAASHLWGFFPGYPMLVRAVMYVVNDAITAGVIVNVVCQFVALVYLARLLMLERDEHDARFGSWMLMLYPYAVFMTALYTESAFLAAATACFYYMRRGDFTLASIAAGVAVAVRVTGIALVIALVVEHLWQRRGRPGPALLPIALSVTPALLFLAYAHGMTGDALAYQHIQQSASFNRIQTWPWTGARNTMSVVISGSPSSNTYIFAMEALFGVLGFAAIVYMAFHWRRFAPSMMVFSAGVWLLGASLVYWLGMPRYEMSIVPFYLVLCDLTRRRRSWRPALLTVSGGWMAFVASMLATGRYTG